jgi:hypothetical protein
MTLTEMPNTTSFEDKLRNRSENTTHLDFQLGDVAFKAGKYPAVTILGNDYALTDGAFRQIAEEMSIPVPYARRIPDDLLAYTVNYFLKDNKNNHLAALTEGDHLRSFMRVNTPYVSNTEMLDAIKDTVGEDYDLKYVKMTDTKTSFSILPAQYRESIDGSNLYGGIKVVYSDSWNVHPTIDSYIWRELCANGMINELEKKKFRVTGSSHDDVLRQIRDFSRVAIEKIPELFDNFNSLLTEQVADYVKTIRMIVLEYKLPNKVLNRLLFWAVNADFLSTISGEKIKNMHDIVNLITYVGSHDSELTDDVRRRLLEIGGNLTLGHHERCGACGSSV